MKPDYRGAWVALYSRLLDSGDFLSLSCAERSVFFQSLLLAARTEHDFRFHGRTYRLQPGQFVTTLPELAKQCGNDCTVKIVRRTIDKLRVCKTWADGRADGRADAPRLITWLNWSLYQLPYGDRADGRADGRAGLGQTEGTQTLSTSSGKNSNTVVTSFDTQTRLVEDSVVTQKRMNRKVPLLTFDPPTQSVVGELEEARQRFAAAFPKSDFDMVLEKMRVWIVKKGNPHQTYWKTLCTIASGEKGEVPMKKFSVGEVGKSNMGEEWG